MSYEPPINLFYQEQLKMLEQINKQTDDAIMAAVRMKVDVDQDELLKALDYDRGQYEKGFEDAKRVLLPMCRNRTKCMSHPGSREYVDWCQMYQEDCNCQCFWKGES